MEKSNRLLRLEAFEAWVNPLWDTATKEAAFRHFKAGWDAAITYITDLAEEEENK